MYNRHSRRETSSRIWFIVFGKEAWGPTHGWKGARWVNALLLMLLFPLLLIAISFRFSKESRSPKKVVVRQDVGRCLSADGGETERQQERYRPILKCGTCMQILYATLRASIANCVLCNPRWDTPKQKIGWGAYTGASTKYRSANPHVALRSDGDHLTIQESRV